jgi:hypothetical protein
MEVAMVEAVLKLIMGRMRRRSLMCIKQVRDRFVMWSENERFLSKMTPKFRTEEARSGGGEAGSWRVKGEDGSVILASCLGSPRSRNSVLEGLRQRRLEVIQEDIREKVDSIIFIESA